MKKNKQSSLSSSAMSATSLQPSIFWSLNCWAHPSGEFFPGSPISTYTFVNHARQSLLAAHWRPSSKSLPLPWPARRATAPTSKRSLHPHQQGKLLPLLLPQQWDRLRNLTSWCNTPLFFIVQCRRPLLPPWAVQENNPLVWISSLQWFISDLIRFKPQPTW